MTPAFSDDTYRTLFGVTKAKDRAFAEDVVAAVAQIDRALLAPPLPHPMAALIAGGVASIDALLGHVERGLAGRGETIALEQAGLDALDALAHVLLYAPASPPVIARLRAVLQHETAPERVALLAKTLAIGRDDELLFQQMRALADPDPGIVASAARLLGFGRYRPALPILKALVQPTRFFESRAVIWALGELGDVDALPTLALAVSQQFRVVDCLMAIGKVRELEGLPIVVPFAAHGLVEQRDAGWRALAMILDGNRGSPVVRGLTPGIVEIAEAALADAGGTPAIRFHALLCLARIAVAVPIERVKRALGVSAGEAQTLAQLMLSR